MVGFVDDTTRRSFTEIQMQQQQQEQPSQILPTPAASRFRLCSYEGYQRNLFAVFVWLCIFALEAHYAYQAKFWMDVTKENAAWDSAFVFRFVLSIANLAVHFLTFLVVINKIFHFFYVHYFPPSCPFNS